MRCSQMYWQKLHAEETAALKEVSAIDNTLADVRGDERPRGHVAPWKQQVHMRSDSGEVDGCTHVFVHIPTA